MGTILQARKQSCLRRHLLPMGVAIFVAGSAASEVAFEYSGDRGPGFWAAHNSQWQACADLAVDARQSPIDINKVRVDRDLSALELDLHETAISLVNTGHVIEQEYEPGSTLSLDGVSYELVQFHFHSLSEHTLNQRQSAMELHAVFKDASSGQLAVVGQLFDVGTANRFLEKLIRQGLPQKQGTSVNSAESINLADAFTSTKAYYRYQGSLTTPPCSEIVSWTVLAEPATLSMRQLQAFRRILGNNFRPLQRLNHRLVRASRYRYRG